jgi:hypothetical protein
MGRPNMTYSTSKTALKCRYGLLRPQPRGDIDQSERFGARARRKWLQRISRHTHTGRGIG